MITDVLFIFTQIQSLGKMVAPERRIKRNLKALEKYAYLFAGKSHLWVVINTLKLLIFLLRINRALGGNSERNPKGTKEVLGTI